MSDGVPCGVAVIVFRDTVINFSNGKSRAQRSVLLGRRLGLLGAGELGFPGGRIEPGEVPEACAARELREETGIEIPLSELMLWIPCPVTNTVFGDQSWVTINYWTLLPAGQVPEICEPEKCEAWEWHSLRCLPRPLFAPTAECAFQSGWWLR